MASYVGRLLVATPRLLDPNFRRTVILMLDHDEDGALGVVLNRPSGLTVDAVLPSWASAVADPGLVFSGGPVSPDGAVAVGVSLIGREASGFRPLAEEYGVVDLDADPDEALSGLVGLRIFAGYAGWSPEQLELEIAEGSWYVVPAVPTDVLNADPERLWRVVLRRQPGELAYVSTCPDDPAMN